MASTLVSRGVARLRDGKAAGCGRDGGREGGREGGKRKEVDK